MANAILRERKRGPTDFANEREANEADAPALGSATGRE
jgi:hypothetical protein